MAGKVESEYVNNRLGVYAQTEKRARLLLQAYAISARYKDNSHVRKLININLISDNEAIEIEDDGLENEKIKCPGKNFALIARHECLDFSGEPAFEACNNCQVGLITKKMILDR